MKQLTYQENQKQRLDKFLAKKLPDFSRNQIQKLIKDKQITVNNKETTAHYSLKANDQISINPKEVTGNQKEKTRPKPKIIDQTDDYLIINKPAGLIVHPADGIKESTLTDWLIEQFPKIKSVGENPKRPGLIHRLDKEVSGVMVIAKSQPMFNHLKKQFQDHQITKEYLALVYGKIENDQGTIDFPLKRSKLTGRIAAKPKGDEGKDAITKFTVLEKFSRYTYLKIQIITGRTHQIRSHLSAYGHPVVGDKLYFNKKIKDNLQLNRIFLHAHLLAFDDLKNQRQEYQSPLTKKLNSILTTLK